MCHSLHSQAAAAAGGLGLHSDFRAGYKHVWCGSETKQYPLLDDTENARAGAWPRTSQDITAAAAAPSVNFQSH